MNKELEKVKSQEIVNGNSSIIWQKLIDFGGTEKFVPELIETVTKEGNGVGATRIIHLKGGGEILEELIFIDEDSMTMKFIILSTPMPLQNYEGVHTVTHLDNNQCNVTFESSYEVADNLKVEIETIIKGFQKTFLSNLSK